MKEAIIIRRYRIKANNLSIQLNIALACYVRDFESSGKGYRLEIVLNRETVLLDNCLLPAQSDYS